MRVHELLDQKYPPLIGRVSRLTSNGYVEYATGITAMAAPELIEEDSLFEELSPEVWLPRAERLAVNGLRKLIAVANYPFVDNLGLLETYFGETRRRLLATRDGDMITQIDELALLHPDIAKFKPLPITEREVFHAIAAGQASELTAEQLLGGIRVDVAMVPSLVNRHLVVD